MTIVVLDGYTLNPGDLDWMPLSSLGECAIYDRTMDQQILERSTNADILLTNKVQISNDLLDKLPLVKYIGVLATGTNVVDLRAAAVREVVVTNVPKYGTASVAQTTVALLLELTQHAGLHGAEVRSGRWSASPDWCFWDRPLIELSGLTLGIVGYGRIGRAVAQIARAFGMNVVATTRSPQTNESGVRFAPLEEIFASSDVVSLHCPLTEATSQIVNPHRLATMKPSAFLINTSRGGLVDEHALAEALNKETIAGAGLDVLSSEPPQADNPLLKARNCIITPHLAWATRAARARLLEIAANNVKAFLSGKPINVVKA